MSPETRTPSSGLGPLPRQGRRLAGGAMATLALVMLGFATPALAGTQTAKGPAGVRAVGGDDDCREGRKDRILPDDHGGECKEKEKEKEKGRTGPTGPTGPAGPTGPTGPAGAAGQCVPDIDSDQRGADYELKALLDPAGNPFGAVRQFNPPAVAQPFIWTPLTRAGFPPNPCGITVTNQVSAASGGEEAHFQVVDAAGTVYTLDCNVINSSGRFVLFCGNATWQLAVSQP